MHLAVRPMMPPAEHNRDDYCSKGESFAMAWQVGNPPAQQPHHLDADHPPAPCVLN